MWQEDSSFRETEISNISCCFGKLIIIGTNKVNDCGCHGNELTTATRFVTKNHFHKEPSSIIST